MADHDFETNSATTGRRLLAGLACALVGLVLPASSASADPVNIALNPSASGLPSPLESDSGWGGGSNPWDIVDGQVSYSTWARGLAFTGGHTGGPESGGYGGTCGLRQATVSLASPSQFDKVVVWQHGIDHTPEVAYLDGWDGAGWQPITFTRVYGAVEEPGSGSGYSTSDEYTFAPVSASKVRYSFDNCGTAISGNPNIHGWIYEVEIFDTGNGAGGGEGDTTQVVVTGGSLSVDRPDVGDFTPVTLDGTPQTTTATMEAFGVADATGTGAGWRLTAQATVHRGRERCLLAGGKVLPGVALAGIGDRGSGRHVVATALVAASPYVLDGAGAVPP